MADQKKDIDYLRGLCLSPGLTQGIFSGNARRLLKV
ncbi:MAG: hypothetical protein KKE64_03765 [Candidatus Omnitrophica bacterium]|nr:hypothetical protein [Candidatus Omnitrophota bacterium]